MAAEVHRPLKVIAFNANGIWRQLYELSKQRQDLHIDVALFSEKHLKRHERFFIANYLFYRTDRMLGRKYRTAVAFRKGILLVSTEATGVCIPTGNSEVLLAAVYKTVGHAWWYPDVTGLFILPAALWSWGRLNS
jgi:hypothetical protein